GIDRKRKVGGPDDHRRRSAGDTDADQAPVHQRSGDRAHQQTHALVRKVPEAPLEWADDVGQAVPPANLSSESANPLPAYPKPSTSSRRSTEPCPDGTIPRPS